MSDLSLNNDCITGNNKKIITARQERKAKRQAIKAEARKKERDLALAKKLANEHAKRQEIKAMLVESNRVMRQYIQEGRSPPPYVSPPIQKIKYPCMCPCAYCNPPPKRVY